MSLQVLNRWLALLWNLFLIILTLQTMSFAVFSPHWFPIEPVSSPNSCHRRLKRDGLCHRLQGCADCNAALDAKDLIPSIITVVFSFPVLMLAMEEPTASGVFCNRMLSMVNSEDVNAIIQAQRHMWVSGPPLNTLHRMVSSPCSSIFNARLHFTGADHIYKLLFGKVISSSGCLN